jgi:hypothetical protein
VRLRFEAAPAMTIKKRMVKKENPEYMKDQY